MRAALIAVAGLALLLAACAWLSPQSAVSAPPPESKLVLGDDLGDFELMQENLQDSSLNDVESGLNDINW